MKLRNKAILFGSLFGATGAVHAAVPAEVTTALAEIQTDMVAVGSLLVLAAAAAIGLKWIKGAIFS